MRFWVFAQNDRAFRDEVKEDDDGQDLRHAKANINDMNFVLWIIFTSSLDLQVN